MATKTYQLETLTCSSCMAKIEGALKRIKSVQELEVLFNASRAKVTCVNPFTVGILKGRCCRNN